MLSQDARMLLSFCSWFVFTDVIKYYTSLEGNLESFECPLQYWAAQTLVCQPWSQTANQNQDFMQDKGDLSESAFSEVFLIPTKSGFNNPSALVGGRDGNDTQSHSGWEGVCDLWTVSVLCHLPDPQGMSPLGSQIVTLTQMRAALNPTINTCTSHMITLISMF